MKTPAPTHAIIGTNAATLAVVRLKNVRGLLRLSGPEAQCREVLALAVRQWADLPHGREIEEAARRHSSQPLALQSGEPEPAPAKLTPAARRRAAQREITITFYDIGQP